MSSPYEGQITIDADLLHALWCYGTLQPVKGVIYSPHSHQECLAIVGRMFSDRAQPLSVSAPHTREPGADVLLAALRDCTCPRPANNEPDDLTIGECFDKKQCGCQNGLALSVSDMARSTASSDKVRPDAEWLTAKHAEFDNIFVTTPTPSAAMTDGPAARSPSLEQIAHAIDGWAFEAVQRSERDGGVADHRVRSRCDEALAQASRVLALLPAAPTTSPEPDAVRGKLPLSYIDGPDYCTVKDATGADFALTMQPKLLQAMEAALSRPAHGGWEDISTAPKDGTKVLVAGDGWMTVAQYLPCNSYWTEPEASGMKLNEPSAWMRCPAFPRNDRGEVQS